MVPGIRSSVLAAGRAGGSGPLWRRTHVVLRFGCLGGPGWWRSCTHVPCLLSPAGVTFRPAAVACGAPAGARAHGGSRSVCPPWVPCPAAEMAPDTHGHARGQCACAGRGAGGSWGLGLSRWTMEGALGGSVSSPADPGVGGLLPTGGVCCWGNGLSAAGAPYAHPLGSGGGRELQGRLRRARCPAALPKCPRGREPGPKPAGDTGAHVA